ncbi:MAG TPA: HypC/HybG/HupF family hydrogenase formation chaperone [Caldithrix abyssi]|uniref:HypC/HybG/HupF family hydrogenase formation chaperone n=1 Tax=Caldithrix abyssi TaxID=187145 RepID=A0A7V1PVL5_CALAY|nr:HypC/HybG/HupF family hydrogenase formation chaperone [Caldithrix abyssi]
MCLAIPGKLIEIFEESGLKMGRFDFAGAFNKACLEYVPEIELGQYAIVHAGFAINIIDEEEARKTYAVWDEMIQAAAEEGEDIFGMPLEEKKEDKEGYDK